MHGFGGPHHSGGRPHPGGPGGGHMPPPMGGFGGFVHYGWPVAYYPYGYWGIVNNEEEKKKKKKERF